MKIKSVSGLLIKTSLICTFALSTAVTADQSVTSSTGTPGRTSVSAAELANAKSRLPMLTTEQLPAEVKQNLGISADGRQTQAYGVIGHPYTTKRAATLLGGNQMIQRMPYSAAGKLWMRFGSGWYVCSASIIDKGVVVTAAHCVSDFGAGTFADEVEFEPGKNDASNPFGTFTATAWAVPSVYSNGTDVCDPGAPGVVCENDMAVVVFDGQDLRNTVGGRFGYKAGTYGYIQFNGAPSAQLTELGYPVSLDLGEKMIRTDSLGYWITPNNVVIGTDQTGGSSGGPWLVNFGIEPNRDSTNPTPTASLSNQVVAVTSWGYTSGTYDLQGASRFGRNTNYTTTTNIKALHDWACSNYPDACL